MNTGSRSIFLSSTIWRNESSRLAREDVAGKTQGTVHVEISEHDLFDGVQHLGRLIWSSSDKASGRRVNPAKGKSLLILEAGVFESLIFPYSKGLREDWESYELCVPPRTKGKINS